jgi:hypothetical protein
MYKFCSAICCYFIAIMHLVHQTIIATLSGTVGPKLSSSPSVCCECSVQCGNFGSQNRKYRCERVYSNDTTEVVKNYMCDDLVKPVYRQDCSGPPCEYSTFQLSYTSEWEECTASCGEMGIQFTPFVIVPSKPF